MDQYCIRIPRTNVLRPKIKDAPEYKQTKIESYCKVLKQRQNVLHPKKNQEAVKARRQLCLEMFTERGK